MTDRRIEMAYALEVATAAAMGLSAGEAHRAGLRRVYQLAALETAPAPAGLWRRLVTACRPAL